MSGRTVKTVRVDAHYLTEDGRSVRIYATDGRWPFPVHGAIKHPDGGWQLACWSPRGVRQGTSPDRTSENLVLSDAREERCHQQIDTAKLRRLICERNKRGAEVVAATDRYLEARAEGEVENLPFIEAAKDRAIQRYEEFDFVNSLIEYARQCGYSVDSVSGEAWIP